VPALGVICLSASYASFFREHKPVRFLLNPVAPIYSTAAFWMRASSGTNVQTVSVIGQPIHRVAYTGHRKPIVLFLVIGETARRANFQLAGYARPTNPELSQVKDLMYFTHAVSCGTATAVSLPCVCSRI
jgi:lipid A ethanolaminephosphotransferase